MKTALLTFLALLAFAGNSVLCRLALNGPVIDAASFTWIRLLSGAVTLLAILAITHLRQNPTKSSPIPDSSATKGSWGASFMLFVYALCFSYAYISLETGTGALILFAAVQITMIGISLFRGHKLHLIEALGTAITFAGFVYLMSPGVSAPALSGLVLMSLAGIAWGIYTLAGKSSANPLSDTAYNFARTTPMLLVVIALSTRDSQLSFEGIWLAVVSGALTSGLGYTIWYLALRGLTALQAAVVQLLVPVIAAFGGVVFASESPSFRLMLASALVIGGILLVILGKHGSEREEREAAT